MRTLLYNFSIDCQSSSFFFFPFECTNAHIRKTLRSVEIQRSRDTANEMVQGLFKRKKKQASFSSRRFISACWRADSCCRLLVNDGITHLVRGFKWRLGFRPETLPEQMRQWASDLIKRADEDCLHWESQAGERQGGSWLTWPWSPNKTSWLELQLHYLFGWSVFCFAFCTESPFHQTQTCTPITPSSTWGFSSIFDRRTSVWLHWKCLYEKLCFRVLFFRCIFKNSIK